MKDVKTRIGLLNACGKGNSPRIKGEEKHRLGLAVTPFTSPLGFTASIRNTLSTGAHGHGNHDSVSSAKQLL